MTEVARRAEVPGVSWTGPHFTWPDIDEGAVLAVTRQLGESVSIYDRSGVVQRVEEALELWHGRAHAVLMNSGTSALHAAYVAAEIGPGDEVIVPNYTFFATASPVFHTGARPVLVDCDRRGNLDPDRVVEAFTDRTRAVVVTHMWGLPADVGELRRIADERGVLLIEDTSHAFGASVHGVPVGAFGDLAAQSLQGQKPLTGGEGGVLLADDDELFYRALAIAHYNVRCKREIPADHELAQYAVTGLGLKWRIHPLAAALVEHQMAVHPVIHAARERCARKMIDRLSRLPGLEVLVPRNGETASWYALVMQVDDRVLDRTTVPELIRRLHARGATEFDHPGSTRPLSQLPLFRSPGHAFRAYRGLPVPSPASSVVADDFHRRMVKLPVWHRLADDPLVDQYMDVIETVWADLGLDE